MQINNRKHPSGGKRVSILKFVIVLVAPLLIGVSALVLAQEEGRIHYFFEVGWQREWLSVLSRSEIQPKRERRQNRENVGHVHRFDRYGLQPAQRRGCSRHLQCRQS